MLWGWCSTLNWIPWKRSRPQSVSCAELKWRKGSKAARAIWRSFRQTKSRTRTTTLRISERKLMKNVNYSRFPHFPFASVPFHRLHPAFVAMTTFVRWKNNFFACQCTDARRKSIFNPFFVLACVFQSSWLCFCLLLCGEEAERKKYARSSAVGMGSWGSTIMRKAGARLIRRWWSKGSPLWWGQQCHRRFEINNEEAFLSAMRNLTWPRSAGNYLRQAKTSTQSSGNCPWSWKSFRLPRSPRWKGERENAKCYGSSKQIFTSPSTSAVGKNESP